jgi:hypothetical protein
VDSEARGGRCQLVRSSEAAEAAHTGPDLDWSDRAWGPSHPGLHLSYLRLDWRAHGAEIIRGCCWSDHCTLRGWRPSLEPPLRKRVASVARN